MKKVSMAAAALALTTLFSTAAMAKEVDIQACTKDGQTAQLLVNVSGLTSQPGIGSIAKPLEAIVRQAFEMTANSMDADKLVGSEGAMAFHKNFEEAMKTRVRDAGASLFIPSEPIILVGAPACSVIPAP